MDIQAPSVPNQPKTAEILAKTPPKCIKSAHRGNHKSKKFSGEILHEYETICPNWWHLPTHILTASTYGLGQITIPIRTSTVQRMNGKCLLFYLRPVGVFVRSVESFLITFDVKFIYFRSFCHVMFPGPHVL